MCDFFIARVFIVYNLQIMYENPLQHHFDTMAHSAHLTRNMCGLLVAVGIMVFIVCFMSRSRLDWKFLCLLTMVGAACTAVGMCCMIRMETELHTSLIGESISQRGCRPDDNSCHLSKMANMKVIGELEKKRQRS
tara:strand:- start:198 stop:602 length:405 start_codon:yes stop_codon:yes gene_type:complete